MNTILLTRAISRHMHDFEQIGPRTYRGRCRADIAQTEVILTIERHENLVPAARYSASITTTDGHELISGNAARTEDMAVELLHWWRVARRYAEIRVTDDGKVQ